MSNDGAERTMNWFTEDGGIWNPYKNKEMKKNCRINELETELEQIFDRKTVRRGMKSDVLTQVGSHYVISRVCN